MLKLFDIVFEISRRSITILHLNYLESTDYTFPAFSHKILRLHLI